MKLLFVVLHGIVLAGPVSSSFLETLTSNCSVFFVVNETHPGCPQNGTEVLDRFDLFIETGQEWQCSVFEAEAEQCRLLASVEDTGGVYDRKHTL